MRRAWKFFVVMVGTGLVMTAVVACGPQPLEGILQKADSVSGEVTVKLKDGGTITFNLKDVKVETLRAAVGTASLEAGSTVTIETDKDKRVKLLKTHTADVEGTISAIDRNNQTVAVTSGATAVEVKNVDSAVFSNLRPGQWVKAKYNVETMQGRVTPIRYTLSTTSAPTGGGSVSPNAGAFDKGTQLTLIATPARYYKFDGWGGTASGNSNPLTIAMNDDKTVVASFSKIMHGLEAQVSPPGGGTVEPARGAYEAGTQATIIATPASGYRFDHWGGGDSGTSNNNLKITMDGNKTVTAYFITVYTLTVSSSPSDGGTISAKGGSYDAGSKVNLSATPLFPYYLKNWTGTDDNNANPTTVTMTADRSVTATFAWLVEGKPQKASGGVCLGDTGCAEPVKSIRVQLNQFDWVQGEIIWQTPTTPNTVVRAYIQDPAGNMVKDFGSIRQTNFAFMAQATGPHSIVFQGGSIWWGYYSLTYTVWGKPQ